MTTEQMIEELFIVAGKHKNDVVGVGELNIHAMCIDVAQRLKELSEQTNTKKWIPCSERLPEEHDSMFKEFKGTNKWNDAMFETISNKVNVTIEFKDGKRATDTSHTTDGKWRCEKEYGLRTKVIAWQPLPKPYKAGDT